MASGASSTAAGRSTARHTSSSASATSAVQTTFGQSCVNPYEIPAPRRKSGRSGVIAPIAIAAGTSGDRANGSAITAWLGVNGMLSR